VSNVVRVCWTDADIVCRFAGVIMCSDQGKYKEAAGLLTEALSIREHTLGNEHPAVSMISVTTAFYCQIVFIYQIQTLDVTCGSGFNFVMCCLISF